MMDNRRQKTFELKENIALKSAIGGVSGHTELCSTSQYLFDRLAFERVGGLVELPLHSTVEKSPIVIRQH